MPTFQSSLPHQHGLAETLGVLVVNLGTPDAPTSGAVRRYLREFLSDPRVVEIPRLVWLPLLYAAILTTRPASSARAYQKIWTDDGSPLMLHTRDIVAGIRQTLEARLSGNVHVALGMTYGNPSIESALGELHDAGARRILVLPLYPQYSGTTTASVFDKVTSLLRRRRWVPETRFINDYHDAGGYISSLAASIREHWEIHGKGDRLLFSFHGIPARTLELGDPYHCQCQRTARLVAESLGLADDDWQVSFQSRLGRAEWLRPYTDETVVEFAEAGVGRLDVVSPGFAADCLETLEEIAIRYADSFSTSGGGSLAYIHALNARDDHVAFLSRLIEKHAGGWPEASHDWTDDDNSRERSRQRALAMGASQ